MNQKRSGLMLAAIAMALSSPAFAGQPATASANTAEQPAQNPPPKDWDGFYAGAHVGGIRNSVDLKSQHLSFIDETCNRDKNFSNFLWGVQGGYVHQYDSKVVVGIEGDFSYNVHGETSLNCPCPPPFSWVSDNFEIKNRMQGSLRARLGYALDHRFLPYITAGVSFADLGISYDNERGDHYSKNTAQAGWALGGGVEWKFHDDWSVRAEYIYTDYGRSLNMSVPTVYGLEDPNGSASASVSSNTFRAAINYWF